MMTRYLCPNCEHELTVLNEIIYHDDEFTHLKCFNAICLSKVSIDTNLLIIKNDKEIILYKYPVIHDDGKIYQIYSIKNTNRTILSERYNRVLILDKFFELDASKRLNIQIYDVLKKLLKMRKFK